jgi:hypothetical protein
MAHHKYILLTNIPKQTDVGILTNMIHTSNFFLLVVKNKTRKLGKYMLQVLLLTLVVLIIKYSYE